jgi:transposase
MAMAAQADTDNTTWPFSFSPQAWEQTPDAVQAHGLTLPTQLHALQQQHRQLQHQVDTLPGQREQTSKTSSKPPSSDAPFTKPALRPSASKRGARQGHPGGGATLLEPTDGQHVSPAPCACGHGQLGLPTLYHAQQVIELPPMELAITHLHWPHAHGGGCGAWRKATIPSAQTTGYGPRFTALMGALGGRHRNARRLGQDCGHSVLQLPMSWGAIQKGIDRGSQAIVPPYETMAVLAHHAPVGYMDETPWYAQHTWPGLWTMTTEPGALSLRPPHRSQEALRALLEAWQGILVSDGYGVYQDWVSRRQTCLAHLMRRARGVSAKGAPARAACGTWALPELQRLCQMAQAPPTGGEWRAW